MNYYAEHLYAMADQLVDIDVNRMIDIRPMVMALTLQDAANEIYRLEQKVRLLEAERPQTDHSAPEAYWLYGGEGVYDVCSHCRQKLYLAIPMKFCPECGAKFRKATPAERYPCPTCTYYDEGAPQCGHCSPANNFLYYQGANHADHLKNP